MRAWFLLATILALTGVRAAESDIPRAVKNENMGTVHLLAPRDWEPIERHHIRFGTTFYRLVPPGKTFDFEILFNDLAHMRMDALVDKDLEIYIESNMARHGPQSVEGKPKAIRFGEKKDGAYARLTDRAPKPGEWLYFTQGVRLLGKDVVLFTLFSNDKDGASLKKALEVVASVRVEK